MGLSICVRLRIVEGSRVHRSVSLFHFTGALNGPEAILVDLLLSFDDLGPASRVVIGVFDDQIRCGVRELLRSVDVDNGSGVVHSGGHAQLAHVNLLRLLLFLLMVAREHLLSEGVPVAREGEIIGRDNGGRGPKLLLPLLELGKPLQEARDTGRNENE